MTKRKSDHSKKQVKKQQLSKLKYQIIGGSFAVVLCIGVFVFFFLSQRAEESYAVDDNAVSYEVAIKKPDGIEGNAITFPAYADTKIQKSTEDFPVVLANPDFNKAYIKFIITIDDNKIPLLTTGLVEPGKAIIGIPLPKDLKEGDHKIYIEMLGYSQVKEPTRLSGTKTSFTLTIVDYE
ncbi:hypothetical protein A5821_002028 [Enterococcus sp. 7F3_DIV0205]|uniref:Uncharacterized protein n=1 Tax=Candidatus Enterococcus palustris TaxID=1834189 RepID=A0AAQ3W980_9ENTE|nr:hypothetical protein [Enterococcus sp. 7F3_DIV0205]OTN82467.1 hypothetical protein A5821_002378 [Enterococcus sp. 7F3_DIV0205]